MKKRLLSWLLILALCLSLLPAAALAEDAPEQTEAPTVQEQAESVRAVNDTAAQATCQITIRRLTGETFTLDVELTETVRSLKQKIQEETGTSMETQSLIFGSTLLEDSRTLAYYGIQNGSTVHLKLQFSSHTAHPICGAAHTGIGDHTGECPAVTWTAWNGTSDIVYDSSNTAYVYLSGNAKRTEILTVAAGYKLYLCLNGYSLTKTTEDSNPGFEGVITIYQGAQFTLCDCKGGGKITHAAGMPGRGVRCGDSSSGSRATFAMFGGEISGNRATGNGGGVYTNENLYTGCTVSGSVDITGNKNTLGIDENVYLRSGAYFVVNADLNADAKIGVTAANDIASGKYVTAAYCPERYSYTDNAIFSDKSEYATLRWQDYVRLYNGLPHVHPDCGDKTCTNTFHTNNNMWTPVSTEAELSAIAEKGSCYLTNNIELTSTYTPKDGVHLCLNGYSLIAKGNFDVITLPDGDDVNNLSLDVCDCNASGNGKGKITHADGKTGRGVYVGIGANFELYGGSITGNHVEGSGGGIYAKGGNFVDLHTGASITGNSATGNGGGVMLTGSDYNNGKNHAAAYFCMQSSGGTISDNTAGGNGGGVYVSGVTSISSSFYTRNVTVTGNKAAKGGGVYVSSTGRLSVLNGAYITGNENAAGAADNVYLKNGRTITLKSALTAGAAIGVTTEKPITDGSYAVVAAGDTVTLSDTDLSAFTSDAGYGTLLKDNKIFFTTGALHEHAICGASCDHETTHGDELWQPLTYDAATMTLYCGGEAVKSSDYRILAGETYILYGVYAPGGQLLSGG